MTKKRQPKPRLKPALTAPPLPPQPKSPRDKPDGLSYGMARHWLAIHAPEDEAALFALNADRDKRNELTDGLCDLAWTEDELREFTIHKEGPLIDRVATPPLQELAILLDAGLYWATAEADEDHPDPAAEALDLFEDAGRAMRALAPEYYHAETMADALRRLVVGVSRLSKPGDVDGFMEAVDALANACTKPEGCE